MAGLVHSDLTTARQANRVIRPQRSSETSRVKSTPLDRIWLRVASRSSHTKYSSYEVQLVLGGTIGGVHGQLGGRQLEDQPATAGIDVGLAQYFGEGRAVSLRVMAVDDEVTAPDYHATLRGGLARGRARRCVVGTWVDGGGALWPPVTMLRFMPGGLLG